MIEPTKYEAFHKDIMATIHVILTNRSKKNPSTETEDAVADKLAKNLETTTINGVLHGKDPDVSSKNYGLYVKFKDIMTGYMNEFNDGVWNERVRTKCQNAIVEKVWNKSDPFNGFKYDRQALPLSCFIWNANTGKPVFYTDETDAPVAHLKKVHADYEPTQDWSEPIYEALSDVVTEGMANKLFAALAECPVENDTLVTMLVHVIINKMSHGPCKGCKAPKELCRNCQRRRDLQDNYIT